MTTSGAMPLGEVSLAARLGREAGGWHVSCAVDSTAVPSWPSASTSGKGHPSRATRLRTRAEPHNNGSQRTKPRWRSASQLKPGTLGRASTHIGPDSASATMEQTKVDIIARNFEANIGRVKNLVAAYDSLGTAGAGRPATTQVDVLRSAVVLMHASLEDLLRSSCEHLLAARDRAVLDEIGLPDGDKMRQKLSLGDLAAFRGRTVDDVIQSAVTASLQRSNYNSVAEVVATLTRVGIDGKVLNPDQATLESIMKRRHLIVHRADKNPNPQRGRGVLLTQHLPKSTAETWTATIEGVGTRIVNALATA